MNNRNLCISIGAGNVKEILEKIENAYNYSDIIEIRADYINNLTEEHITELLDCKKKELILTIRKEDGGLFKGSEERRIKLFKKAIDSGVDYIDIEFSSSGEIIDYILNNRGNTKVICSYHNFTETPSLIELEENYEKIKSLKPDLIKIVTSANSINDNFRIFELLKGKNDLISFTMGVRGQISRILAPIYGSFFTYSSMADCMNTASGQISAHDLINVYNYHLLTKDTKILGVIGSHAENSLSKYMHNANFKEKNLDYIYVPFKVEPEELEEFMENFRKYKFSGAAVTIPHKVEVMKYLDILDEGAEKIGAVNTIVKDRGKLTGYNTDCKGAIEALKKKSEIKGKKILVFGAGGASRALCYGMKKEGGCVTITNRNCNKGIFLAKEMDVTFLPPEEIYDKDYDILINTTSVGMYPNTEDRIVPKSFLKGKTVFDIVYRPMMTGMLKDALEMKCRIAEGYEMLLYQGIEQYRLWTSEEPDEDIMRSVLFEQLREEEHK